MATILIVEDEEALAEVLQNQLKKSNFNVEVARDGEEALEKLQKIKPDLILLDLILPKMNGFEVLERVKGGFETRSIPVIVLSNLGSDEDIKRAIKLGAEDYYVKVQHPIFEIVEKVSKFLAIPRSPIETSEVLTREVPLSKKEVVVPEVKKEEVPAEEPKKVVKEAEPEEEEEEDEEEKEMKIKLPKGVRKFIREKKREIKETISDPKERHKKITELYESYAKKEDQS